MASAFQAALKRHKTRATAQSFVFVPYDQLTASVGPLSRTEPGDCAILMIESLARYRRRPYHQQKILIELANGRQFALEQAEAGRRVIFIQTDQSIAEELCAFIAAHGKVQMMEPAEYELRMELLPLVQSGDLQWLPNETWTSLPEDFEAATRGKKTIRMDAFYRVVRSRLGILMDGDHQPLGGKWSFDSENREPWNGTPKAPTFPSFGADPIKAEVADLIAAQFATHPGRMDLKACPATMSDAEMVWAFARTHCLPHFGPYEDAMSASERALFHTKVSTLVNLSRLDPMRLVREAEVSDAPLASREGFIRQIIGWREFVRHLHRITDGFRKDLSGNPVSVQERPGDGGYWAWYRAQRGESAAADAGAATPGDPKVRLSGGAMPSHLGARDPLPPAYWGQESGLNCLDQVVRSVWDEAYSHHITRLMILGNLATLLDLSPRDLTDWFWIAYSDAFDWVVEPNVLGMATYALGDLMTTKPYVSGAAYIARMSDYCKTCAFDPKTTCPITPLYWAFLSRHQKRLGNNPRLAMPMRSLAKRSASQKNRDAEIFSVVRDALQAGEVLTPSALDDAEIEG